MKKIFATAMLFASLLSCRKEDKSPVVYTDLKISSIWPDNGAGSIVVTVNGRNFSSNIGEDLVQFNGVKGTIISATTTELQVVTPDQVTTGAVTLTVKDKTVTGPVFTYKMADTATANYVITTYAGAGTSGYLDGAADIAQFKAPEGVAMDKLGNIIVADRDNNVIRKITPRGEVSTIAGTGTAGYADGPGNAAMFKSPFKVAIDNDNNIIVADRDNFKIRKVTPDGVVSTIAGSTGGFADGSGSSAKFAQPLDVAVDAIGNIYVADNTNHRIRKVTPSGTVSTLAGSGTAGYADGTGTAAMFKNPSGLTLDNSGNIIVADRINNLVRKVTPDGIVTTVAGTTAAGTSDGPAASATFNNPYGVVVDADGNIYVADLTSALIRKITPDGAVTTIAGSGSGFADGLSTTAKFNQPTDVTIDADGNILVADLTNRRVRMIKPVR
ncbi:MAG TPA: IPT/TIG domain-containing protein [Puia sp.]|jgi:sugar lactone lactonase YvrE